MQQNNPAVYTIYYKKQQGQPATISQLETPMQVFGRKIKKVKMVVNSVLLNEHNNPTQQDLYNDQQTMFKNKFNGYDFYIKSLNQQIFYFDPCKFGNLPADILPMLEFDTDGTIGTLTDCIQEIYLQIYVTFFD